MYKYKHKNIHTYLHIIICVLLTKQDTRLAVYSGYRLLENGNVDMNACLENDEILRSIRTTAWLKSLGHPDRYSNAIIDYD